MRPTSVRGHPAWYSEVNHEAKQQPLTYRSIHWFEEKPDGTTIWWNIGSSPQRYSLEEVVKFANELHEVS